MGFVDHANVAVALGFAGVVAILAYRAFEESGTAVAGKDAVVFTG